MEETEGGMMKRHKRKEGRYIQKQLGSSMSIDLGIGNVPGVPWLRFFLC